MKKTTNFLMALLLSFIVAPLLATNVHAENYVKADNDFTSAETINHSFFMAGNNITSNDNVNGILFAAGNSLNTAGKSEYAAFAGNSVLITGTIEKDAFAAGNILRVEKATIGRDLYVAGNSITINSNLNGNVFAGGNSIVFGSDITINGNVKLSAESISFSGPITINGKLEYNDNATVTDLDRVSASETTTYHVEEASKSSLFVSTLTVALAGAASLTLIAVIMLALFPKIYEGITKKSSAPALLKHLLVGLCSAIVIPTIAIIILLTIWGIPISIVFIVIYCLLLYLSEAFSGILLGNAIVTKLFKGKSNKYLEALIGIFLIALASIIPFAGAFISLIATFVGFGIIIEMIFSCRKAK